MADPNRTPTKKTTDVRIGPSSRGWSLTRRRGGFNCGNSRVPKDPACRVLFVLPEAELRGALCVDFSLAIVGRRQVIGHQRSERDSLDPANGLHRLTVFR